MGRSRVIWFQVVAVCLGIITGVLIAEAALRLAISADYPPPLRQFISFMHQTEGAQDKSPLFKSSADSLLSYELRPNARNNLIRINSAGFRGPDYSKEVPDRKVRLAVVGDSETFGQRLPEDKTLPGAMQTLLNKGSDHKYEVLNFGVPGYNSAQELRMVERKVLDYHPEVMFLYYVFNDPIISSRTFLINKTPFHRLMLTCFLDWYFFKRVTKEDLGNEFAGALANPDPRLLIDYFLRLHESEYFETTKLLIKRMAQLARKQHCRFILVIAPELYGIDDFKNYPYHRIHRKLKELASSDIEVVDPLPELMAVGKRPGDFWVTDDDCHKNAEANAVIAAAVLQATLFKPQ
jgi:lysophospholipase L1-like esterase